jgi:hypothetical protein
MSDNTAKAPRPDPAERRCAEPDCESGDAPPAGYDTCEPCAWEAYFAERERQLLAQITGLEAALADAIGNGPGPGLRALLERFGPGSSLGMRQAAELRAGDVFAWPWAQIRAVAPSRDSGTDAGVCVFYGHGAEEVLAVRAVHLVLRPGDPARPCPECGRSFIAGCAEPCLARYIAVGEIATVLAEAGLYADR